MLPKHRMLCSIRKILNEIKIIITNETSFIENLLKKRMLYFLS